MEDNVLKKFITNKKKKGLSKKEIINKLKKKNINSTRIKKFVDQGFSDSKNNDLDSFQLPPYAVEYWGPCAWKFIHTITFSYNIPEDSKEKIVYQKNFKDFFQNLAFILPCPHCRKHYQEHIYKDIDKRISKKDFDKAFDSRDKLIKYFYDFHSKVNSEKGKRSFIEYEPNLDFETFKKIYSNQDIWKNKNPSFMADPYWGKPPQLK